jgi:ferredoxin
VVAMEGDGPSAGDPRHVGAILASGDSLACDVAAARLVGMDPLEVSTLRVAAEEGRISARVEDLHLAGESLYVLQIKGFRPASAAHTRLMRTPLFDWLVDLLGRWVSPHPVVGDACTGCSTCAQNCPAEAITILHGRAHIDYRRCIHCFCCQELCPERAMTVRYPRLTRWWARPG